MLEITLNYRPLSIATSDREWINESRWYIVWTIRVYPHGNPSALNLQIKWSISMKETSAQHMNQRIDRKIPTSGVPRTQSRMWSQAELAADNALDSFLALMIAAPRCWTVAMNSPCSLWVKKLMWILQCTQTKQNYQNK